MAAHSVLAVRDVLPVFVAIPELIVHDVLPAKWPGAAGSRSSGTTEPIGLNILYKTKLLQTSL
ncbi:MAG: hypothetical protein DA446_07625 [Bacteroidetes bacterium]|nr:MAG: hypothetical protein DA446_07625 [Bacteroidota bacterium]